MLDAGLECGRVRTVATGDIVSCRAKRVVVRAGGDEPTKTAYKGLLRPGVIRQKISRGPDHELGSRNVERPFRMIATRRPRSRVPVDSLDS